MANFTPTEKIKEIFRYLDEGRGIRKTSSLVGVARNTVKWHLRHNMRKFDCVKYQECLNNAAHGNKMFNCESCKDYAERCIHGLNTIMCNICIGKIIPVRKTVNKNSPNIEHKELGVVKTEKVIDIKDNYEEIRFTHKGKGEFSFNEIAIIYLKIMNNRIEVLREEIKLRQIEYAKLSHLTIHLDDYIGIDNSMKDETIDALLNFYKMLEEEEREVEIAEKASNNGDK